MSDVRDQALEAALDREATRIESAPVDRLPEVLRRGRRLRAIRFTAIAAAVAVFAGVVSWAGLQNEGRGTIPADVDDWDTFASLEDNGWTVQVPPAWRVQELPACPNAPERIGVVVTNVDFEFLSPRGESPQCEDRFVFQGFPSDGVALAFMPRGDIPGIFGFLPDTTLPLTRELLIDSTGIRGGPAEASLAIFLQEEWLGMLRRYEGPTASARDVAALDRMLGSFRVRGAPRWIHASGRASGDIRASFVRPNTWSSASYPHAIVLDAPTPILRLRSPEVLSDGCGSTPSIGGSRFRGEGVEIVVFDASGSWGPPDLPPRPSTIRLRDAAVTRTVSCRGERLRVFTFGFDADGLPIYVDLAASETIVREQPQMLLYILNSIRVEPA
jgi:hypothetical protein